MVSSEHSQIYSIRETKDGFYEVNVGLVRKCGGVCLWMPALSLSRPEQRIGWRVAAGQAQMPGWSVCPMICRGR